MKSMRIPYLRELNELCGKVVSEEQCKVVGHEKQSHGHTQHAKAGSWGSTAISKIEISIKMIIND